jgi:NADPH-dependent 2,4-dienoyl-CoA reductase/sulfur reductase-like enzyme
MVAIAQAELRKHGVQLLLNNGLASFDSPRESERAAASVVVLADGSRVPADLVILGLGVRPESKLAADAGLTLGKTGGIAVNERLKSRTASPGKPV